MGFSSIRKFFAPAPHIPRLPEGEVKRRYPKFRWSILESTFLGYGMFYLVRNNISVVSKEMGQSLGYTYAMIGQIMAITAICYGVGKFLMGSVSDRSNVRRFMPFGLLMTAGLNLLFGATSTYGIHLGLWALNGFVQGMGWGPCGRSMGHWFSVRERGTVFSIWNTSHNVGGGIAGILAARAAAAWGWQNAFYVPAVVAIVGAIYLFWRLRDTPQSVGLPSIEEYKDDFTEDERIHGTHEKELSTRELFIDHVLANKYIWLLAIANFFAYIVRYSMWDWGPLYLREIKGASLEGGGIAIMALNFGGIPSTILLGWLSDKIGGRRGMVAVICLVPIAFAFIGIILNPPGRLWLDMLMLMTIGFLIYPVINLITIIALDVTSKKAIGTAAGFIGLFGYIAKSVEAKGFGWMVDYFTELYGKQTAWNIILWTVVGCVGLAVIFMGFTWRLKPKA
ncbi:MAG: MFS transporter [Candidatus Marinimicrobia bacterium]|nr:MFS transporter [Candidatus Neomarinimicrobiota bacterium]